MSKKNFEKQDETLESSANVKNQEPLVTSETQEVAPEVVKTLEERVTELEGIVKALTEKLENVKTRDRGPSSTREMTDDDARRVLVGDLKDKSHKVAAEELNLSYAQVYSCRGHYTFKHIHKEIENAKKELAAQ